MENTRNYERYTTRVYLNHMRITSEYTSVCVSFFFAAIQITSTSVPKMLQVYTAIPCLNLDSTPHSANRLNRQIRYCLANTCK